MPSHTPKKNVSIEVRLADADKHAFADHCRRNGLTASDAIRGFIADRLAERGPPRRRSQQRWRLALALIVGSGLGAGIAAPSFAQSAPSSRAAFERLDRNHDRVLSYEEFRAR